MINKLQQFHKNMNSNSIHVRPKALLTFGLIVATLYIAVIFAFRNTTFSTSNGLWKIPEALNFWTSAGGIDYANLLYRPIHGAWMIMFQNFGMEPVYASTLLNALMSALSSALLVLLFRRIGLGIQSSFSLATLYALSGGIITSAIGSEDIAYVLPPLVLLANELVNLDFFKSPKTLARIGILLAIIHGCEWRVVLPIYVGLFLALVIFWVQKPESRSSLIYATLRISLFYIGFLFLLFAMLTALLGRTFSTILSFVAHFAFLGFPGKGIGTGWGGFELFKVGQEFGGISQNFFGGINFSNLGSISQPILMVSGVIGFFIFLYSIFSLLKYMSKNNGERLLVFVSLGATFGGVILNLYSQPQDPQMQVTGSIWLFVGLALAVRKLEKIGVSGIQIAGTSLILCLLSVASFQGGLNFWQTNAFDDDKKLGVVAKLNSQLSPRTILIGSGFESEIAYLHYKYGQLNWLGVENQNPTFPKVLAHVSFPVWYPEESVDDWLCRSATAIVESSAYEGRIAFIEISPGSTYISQQIETVLVQEKLDQFKKGWASLISDAQMIDDERTVLVTKYCGNKFD